MILLGEVVEHRKSSRGTKPSYPIIPFYKRGCQDKCLAHDGKAQGKWSCRPAPAMERDSVNFPFPQIHRAVGTTPFSSRRRQADGLCCANHGSIGDFSPIAFSGCPRGHRVSRKTECPKHTPNGILDTHPRTRAPWRTNRPSPR